MLHKLIDTVAAFCGTALFLLLNMVFYAAWLLLNTITPLSWHYDSYPFSAMTTVLSIEAILLTVFVLISQNRQGERDRARAEAEFQLNVKEDREEGQILDILNKQNVEIAALRELLEAKRTRK